MKFNIKLPLIDGTEEIYETEDNIVIVGANGAGKTRFSIELEELIQDEVTVHRISAQKALNISDKIIPSNLEDAEKKLIFGRNDGHESVRNKKTARYGGDAANCLMNDYDNLISALFAQKVVIQDEYTQKMKEVSSYIQPPETNLDKISRIWNELLPHCKLTFTDYKVLVNIVDNDDIQYTGKNLSDGERVLLYFIGQCISVPENSIIIIDEPELHLHKTLVNKLWNKIESILENKIIIYITHDLEFASSRVNAEKIWIKKYLGEKKWDWEFLPEDDAFPEPLMLEMLGSRKPILFCEGEKGGLDSIFYEAFYTNFHIVPRGGCDKVIESTKAFKNNQSLHQLEAYVIIDRDYREQEEIDILETHNIFTLPVAEVENLFCIEPIIRLVANHLVMVANDKVEEVKTFIINELNDEFENQVSTKSERIIEFKLGAYTKNDKNKQGLKDGLTQLISEIDIDTIYDVVEQNYNDAISSRDLDKLLLIYNRKTLANRISSIFELDKKSGYTNLVIRFLNGKKRIEIVDTLKNYLPDLK